MPASDSAPTPPRQPGTPQGAGTWQSMVASNQALLLRKTGQDVHSWVDQARAAGIGSDAELRDWMRDGFGVTGYAQYAVSWEMFGYPDFMLRDADELLDGQYAAHPHLRPIADALLAWAAATDGVAIQLRKGFVSLQGPRRKFAQITRTTNTAVDVTLRLDGAAEGRAALDGAALDGTAEGRLEQVRTRPDDPFRLRVRLTSSEQVDDELLGILAEALARNS